MLGLLLLLQLATGSISSTTAWTLQQQQQQVGRRPDRYASVCSEAHDVSPDMLLAIISSIASDTQLAVTSGRFIGPCQFLGLLNVSINSSSSMLVGDWHSPQTAVTATAAAADIDVDVDADVVDVSMISIAGNWLSLPNSRTAFNVLDSEPTGLLVPQGAAAAAAAHHASQFSSNTSSSDDDVELHINFTVAGNAPFLSEVVVQYVVSLGSSSSHMSSSDMQHRPEIWLHWQGDWAEFHREDVAYEQVHQLQGLEGYTPSSSGSSSSSSSSSNGANQASSGFSKVRSFCCGCHRSTAWTHMSLTATVQSFRDVAASVA
jgi:hypothetical protein